MKKARSEMFHSVNDGKGNRRIYVNNNEIKHVLWANEEQGLVCCFKYPYKINKRKDGLCTRILRGKVKVEMINGVDGSKADKL